ncbi:capsular biosynthesis protein [Cupriavidus sp. H18C1]|uniref:capsular biosynthesis protein n=1 Tax=Cupriavidus sp. H18C1 TaxID=3241601 RepID=UPI003BB8DBA3
MSESPESLDAMLIVDIDGTLCDIKSPGQSYAEVEPRRAIIDKLREYRERGYHIMLYTSRNMRTYNNNLGLINKHTAPVLLEWLARWDVPYDEILFGKPWPRHKGFYVDDRAVRPSEFLSMSEQEIQDLLARE